VQISKPIAIAALLLSTWGTPAMAQSPTSPVVAESITQQMILGCWTRQRLVPDDGNYWSLCFLENGQVESTVISGVPGHGLGGTSSAGTYEISKRRVRFVFDFGDYGWLWRSGDVVWDACVEDEGALAFTRCNDGEPDMLFERH
jgi:hypothetical protein